MTSPRLTLGEFAKQMPRARLSTQDTIRLVHWMQEAGKNHNSAYTVEEWQAMLDASRHRSEAT